MPDDTDAAIAKYGGATTAPPPPDDTDAAIAKYGGSVEQPSQVPLGNQPWSVSGVAHTMLNQAGDFATGVAKGAASTMFHGGDLIRRGLGMERVINRPEVQQGITPTNTAQKIGSGVEQAAEFAIPGRAVSAAAKVVEAATKVPAARVLGKAVMEAMSAGGVAGAQSGGDTNTMKNAALAAGGTSAVLGGIGAALPSKSAVAKRLYGSALKPPPSMGEAERDAIINTGLKEGLTLNPDVVQTAQKRISDLNDQISQEIQQRAAAGATVDPTKVASYTDRSAGRFANQVNPEADLQAVQGVKDEFLRTNSAEAPYTTVRPMDTAEGAGYVPTGKGSTQIPQDIPLDQAQKIKQGTYAKLRGSYGEQASAAREAQKDLARGLKDQIVKAFPEISNLNARESSLLQLEASLERFAGREGNKQLIGLGTPMTATALHSVAAPAAIPLTLLKAALEMPAVKSRLAIALSRAATNPGVGTATMEGAAALAPKVAAYGATPNGQQRTIPPPQ